MFGFGSAKKSALNTVEDSNLPDVAWKCEKCSEGYFTTVQDLMQHVRATHPHDISPEWKKRNARLFK